jgi:hypothetical protein
MSSSRLGASFGELVARTAQPGKEGFSKNSVLLLERRTVVTGAQSVVLLVDQEPKWVGVDPFNKRIDRKFGRQPYDGDGCYVAQAPRRRKKQIHPSAIEIIGSPRQRSTPCYRLVIYPQAAIIDSILHMLPLRARYSQYFTVQVVA